MNDTTNAPMFATTIDQHVGVHQPTGLMETRLKEIRTSFTDHCEGKPSWDEMSSDEQQWWHSTLEDIHAATVELAECEPEIREEVNQIQFDGDLEDYAAWLRREIAGAMTMRS